MMDGGEVQAAPLINISGKKVALGPLRRDLLPLYLRWLNDFEVTRTMGVHHGPMTMEAEQAWYERVSKHERDAHFTIYAFEQMEPIGTTGLGIDPARQSAMFGIMIGDKRYWDKGCGTEATSLMLDYGFTVLGLHSIYLWVAANNQRGVRAYGRVGFKEAGRRREAHRQGSQYQDLILMDCLAAEFTSPVLRQFFEGA